MAYIKGKFIMKTSSRMGLVFLSSQTLDLFMKAGDLSEKGQVTEELFKATALCTRVNGLIISPTGQVL